MIQPDYDEVLILVRKELPIEHKKLVQLVIDFDKLDEHAAAITGHAVFCCLGSTQKKTPDLTVYRKIDHDYPVKLAQLAKQNGVKQYHLVSAIGANSKSSNFYTKMKGETEDDMQKVGLKCLHIYQPSFLTGRQERIKADGAYCSSVIMKVINPLLIGRLKKIQEHTCTKPLPGQCLMNL